MTPTATYIAEENCLQELPTMEQKPWPHILNYESSTDFDEACWKRSLHEADYRKHLATLRKIPCDPSCKGLWADQQKVVEGKDYEVKTKCTGKSADCLTIKNCQYCESMALPLVPVKSEDELCTGIFPVQRLTNGSGHSNLTIITEEAIPDVYIGSLLLVPFVHGYKDPEKVKVLLDENGKPVATKLRTCIVVEYIFA